MPNSFLKLLLYAILKVFNGGINKITLQMLGVLNKQLYDKVLNLASDPKEHFNIGLHIIQNQ